MPRNSLPELLMVLRRPAELGRHWGRGSLWSECIMPNLYRETPITLDAEKRSETGKRSGQTAPTGGRARLGAPTSRFPWPQSLCPAHPDCTVAPCLLCFHSDDAGRPAPTIICECNPKLRIPQPIQGSLKTLYITVCKLYPGGAMRKICGQASKSRREWGSNSPTRLRCDRLV